MPPGCKDLIDVLHGAKWKPSLSSGMHENGRIRVRVNGQIRAPEVRVVGERGGKLGIMAIYDALRLAKSRGIDLIEIAPHSKPPVCRLVDYGKFRYESSKKA